jgi:hypothetical protein
MLHRQVHVAGEAEVNAAAGVLLLLFLGLCSISVRSFWKVLKRSLEPEAVG